MSDFSFSEDEIKMLKKFQLINLMQISKLTKIQNPQIQLHLIYVILDVCDFLLNMCVFDEILLSTTNSFKKLFLYKKQSHFYIKNN